MTRILVTCAQMKESLPALQDEIDALGWSVNAPELNGQQFSEEELIDLLPGIDGVIAGDDPFTRRVIESTSQLRVISKWGVGIDGIDVPAAEERGIAVTRTPEMFGDEVADVALGYVICLARGLVDIHNAATNGDWLKPSGFTLRGKAAAIVGLGSIGVAVAQRLQAVGMEVRAVDPTPEAVERARDLGVRIDTLEAVADGANLIVTACPLNENTLGTVNAQIFDRMGNPAWLVHVSRGPVVNQEHARQSLRSGGLTGAAFDVFAQEPLPAVDPIRGCPNVLFGSHNGSHTQEATLRASRAALANLMSSLGQT